jgi:integrase
MRNPNGYGTTFKLKGNRRKPWIARKTVGFNDKGQPIYNVIGYYLNQPEAILALAEFNKNPLSDNNNATFKEVFELWKTQKYKDASKSLINVYNSAFNHSESLYKMRFCDIKTAHLNNAIAKCDRSSSTANMMRVLYKQLYKYAMSNDISIKDYSAYLDKIIKTDDIIERIPFSQDELDTLFNNVSNIPYIDTILMMCYSGVRIGELLNIKINDVHIAERYFIVTDSKTAAGKNRLVPIHSKTLPLFKNRLKVAKEYLIPSRRDKKMSYSTYQKYAFLPIMEKLNMTHRPHDCRHTFATLANNAEANKTSIKSIIGHAHFRTSEKVYTHKDIQELTKAVDLIK